VGRVALALPHHLGREPAAGDRGRAFGRAHADAVAVTVRTYRRLLNEAAGVPPGELPGVGERVAAAVTPRWPDLVEEVEGIAAGAGQDARELLAINARTELLAAEAAAECSVIARHRAAGVELAQNWDWHPDLAPARVIVTAAIGGGPRYTTITEAGILAKLGLNDSGIATALNFLTTSGDGGVDGIPIHVLLRVLLDRCATALTALELLQATAVATSACVTVAAAEPDGDALFAAELSPAGTSVIWPDDRGHLVHTNHFLAPPAAGVDTQPSSYPSTLLRLEHLRRAVAAGAPPERSLQAHVPAGEAVCRHEDESAPWHERRATLLSVLLRPRSGELLVAPGPPCRTPFAAVTTPA
jgi:isopenicillin-N N-acyltransferase like protein